MIALKRCFRCCVAAYIVITPIVAMLMVSWVPFYVMVPLFALHALLIAPTFIPNGSWFAPIVRRFETRQREVFLTLDDGPDIERTPHVLQLLSDHDAKACFFVIGQRVRAHPELAHAMVAQGHELGNHTHYHRERWFWSYLWGDVTREMKECSRAIKETTGFHPRWFRSPVGMTNPFVYPAARALGLRILGWSAWARDVTTEDADLVVGRVLARLCPGAVLVLHPERTGIECLGKVLAELHRLGYRCVLPGDNAFSQAV